MTDAALPEGLQPLLDRQQIEDVLTRYSRAVDRADIDLLKTCYHDDATEDHAGVFTGTARDYVEQIAGLLPRADAGELGPRPDGGRSHGIGSWRQAAP